MFLIKLRPLHNTYFSKLAILLFKVNNLIIKACFSVSGSGIPGIGKINCDNILGSTKHQLYQLRH